MTQNAKQLDLQSLWADGPRKKESFSNEVEPVLLSDRECAKILGLSRATFWRRVSDGTFPKPIKIGGRTLWLRVDLIRVVEKLAREQCSGASNNG